jgi:hypothetical protein
LCGNSEQRNLFLETKKDKQQNLEQFLLEFLNHTNIISTSLVTIKIKSIYHQPQHLYQQKHLNKIHVKNEPIK